MKALYLAPLAALAVVAAPAVAGTPAPAKVTPASANASPRATAAQAQHKTMVKRQRHVAAVKAAPAKKAS